MGRWQGAGDSPVVRYAHERNLTELREQDGARTVKQGTALMNAELIGRNRSLVTLPRGSAA